MRVLSLTRTFFWQAMNATPLKNKLLLFKTVASPIKKIQSCDYLFQFFCSCLLRTVLNKTKHVSPWSEKFVSHVNRDLHDFFLLLCRRFLRFFGMSVLRALLSWKMTSQRSWSRPTHFFHSQSLTVTLLASLSCWTFGAKRHLMRVQTCTLCVKKPG